MAALICCMQSSPFFRLIYKTIRTLYYFQSSAAYFSAALRWQSSLKSWQGLTFLIQQGVPVFWQPFVCPFAFVVFRPRLWDVVQIFLIFEAAKKWFTDYYESYYYCRVDFCAIGDSIARGFELQIGFGPSACWFSARARGKEFFRAYGAIWAVDVAPVDDNKVAVGCKFLMRVKLNVLIVLLMDFNPNGVQNQ